jgi:hypothetical protein
MIFQILLKKTELFSTCFYQKYHFLQYFLKIMTFYFIFLGISGDRWCQVVIDGKNTYPKEQSFFYYFAQEFK